MSEEYGNICGVKVILDSKTYNEYKNTLIKQIEELQQKIDKAIDYINTSIKPLDTKILNNNEIDTLLEILEK